MQADNASRPVPEHPDDPVDDIPPELHAVLQRIGAQLRQTPLPHNDLDRSIMAAVRRSPQWRIRAILGWWLRPRAVPVSPLAGVVAAAAIIALAVVSSRRRDLPPHVASSAATALPRSASEAQDVRIVRFVLAAPGASRVHVVGDFNGWNTGATPLQPVGRAGVWTVDVPLTPGRHEYAFVVDEHEWRPDPSAPRAPTNDFGPANSVITIEAHSS